MTDSPEKLQHELQAAQRTIAELQAKLENRETGQRLVTLELEENRGALLFMLEDLEAGRKKIEQAHQEWMAALDVVDDPIFLHDKEFRILRCNKAYQQRAGIPFNEIIGQLYYEVFPKTGGPLSSCLHALDKKEEKEEEVTVGGTIYRSRAFSIKGKQGAYLYSVHTLEDITRRKQTKQKLKDLSDRLQHILASTPAVHYACQVDGEHFVPTFASANLKAIWGYDPAEYLGNAEWWWSSIHPEGRDSVVEAFRAAVTAAGRSHYVHEYRFRRKDGTYRWVHDELQIIRDQAGQPLEIVGSWLDITERKQAEAAIQHANRALAALSAVNHALVHATSENDLLQAICDAIVEQRGYRMAWVGYKQHDESKSIKIMAHAGHDEGYLDTTQISWAENERGMGPTGRAIRSMQTQVCRDIANDPAFLPWRDAALQRGYRSSIALPLADGEAIGALMVYADEPNAFDNSETALLEEMAGDLAFGVYSLHTRHERDLALEQNRRQLMQLESNLEDTVRAIATIVEMRDPYTAGHQVRVADLATAIAKQMGLPEEQIHAIHLAGIVHDLGKIRIPAEILSKPGKITDLEFSLIKIHPQAGYDILNGIDFPWPIAQMVLQHHERMDGSGYPQGLKGDAILLEARILSVADVVEAISAHRPYRAGLGIDVAMEEITKNCGKFYDPQVVDACLTLFSEQGYKFK